MLTSGAPSRCPLMKPLRDRHPIESAALVISGRMRRDREVNRERSRDYARAVGTDPHLQRAAASRLHRVDAVDGR